MRPRAKHQDTNIAPVFIYFHCLRTLLVRVTSFITCVKLAMSIQNIPDSVLDYLKTSLCSQVFADLCVLEK